IMLHYEAGASVLTYVSLGTSLDMDTEEDLLLLKTGSLEPMSLLFYRRSYPSSEQREWYVVHTYRGYENKVKKTLERRMVTLDIRNRIFRIEVPTVEEIAISGGQRHPVQRRMFPGYVLVEMMEDRELLRMVRDTPGVTAIEKFDRRRRG